MSNRIVTSGYTPYGAYELKATYQRNMLLAIVIVTATVGIVLLSAAVWSAFAPAPGVIIGPCVMVIPPVVGERLVPPTPIKIKVPRGGDIERSSAFDNYVIPTMVTDSDYVEDTASILSYDEPAVYGEGEVDKTGSEEGNLFGEGGSDSDQFGVSGGMGVFLPPDDQFQAVELYPQMIHRHIGEYPRLARRAGIEGTVHVKVLVDEEGKVMKVMLAHSSGVDGLDVAAVEWAADCQFSPGIQNGLPVKVWVMFKYDFLLDR